MRADDEPRQSITGAGDRTTRTPRPAVACRMPSYLRNWRGRLRHDTIRPGVIYAKTRFSSGSDDRVLCRLAGATSRNAADGAPGVAGNVFQQNPRNFREAL